MTLALAIATMIMLVAFAVMAFFLVTREKHISYNETP